MWIYLVLFCLYHLNFRCGYRIRIWLLILQVLWKIATIDDETIVININVLHRLYIQNRIILLLISSCWLGTIILKLAEIILKLQLIFKINLISAILVVAEASVVEVPLINLLKLTLAIIVLRSFLWAIDNSFVWNELSVLIHFAFNYRLFAFWSSSNLDFAIWTACLSSYSSWFWTLSKFSQGDICIKCFTIAFFLCSLVHSSLRLTPLQCLCCFYLGFFKPWMLTSSSTWASSSCILHPQVCLVIDIVVDICLPTSWLLCPASWAASSVHQMVLIS